MGSAPLWNKFMANKWASARDDIIIRLWNAGATALRQARAPTISPALQSGAMTASNDAKSELIEA